MLGGRLGCSGSSGEHERSAGLSLECSAAMTFNVWRDRGMGIELESPVDHAHWLYIFHNIHLARYIA